MFDRRLDGAEKEIFKISITTFLVVCAAISLTVAPSVLDMEQQAGQTEERKCMPKQSNVTQSQKAQETRVVKEGLFRVSNILNKKIKNVQGEEIGTITDLVAGREGTLKYAILDHGGSLGIDSKPIPIPWKAVKGGRENDTFIVNVTKSSLEKAPNFDSKKWPNFAKPDWEKKIEHYYVIERDQSKSQWKGIEQRKRAPGNPRSNQEPPRSEKSDTLWPQ